MRDYSPVDRPLTLTEIATGWHVSRARLKRITVKHGIRPACFVGPLDCYGLRQLRRMRGAIDRQDKEAAAKAARLESSS